MERTKVCDLLKYRTYILDCQDGICPIYIFPTIKLALRFSIKTWLKTDGGSVMEPPSS